MREDREAGVEIERGKEEGTVIDIETEVVTDGKVGVEVVKGKGTGEVERTGIGGGTAVEAGRGIDRGVGAGNDRGGDEVTVGRDVKKEAEVPGMTERVEEVQIEAASSELCQVAS